MPWNETDLLAALDRLGIGHVTVRHPPLFTVEDAVAHWAGIPGLHAKNLFLKDAKDALWLVTVRHDIAVDLKALPALMGSKRLSFGRAELLKEMLGVEPGSVTPFAVANDADGRVTLVLDAALAAAPLVNFHPLDNAATTTISGPDLLRFARALGHEARLVDFDAA